MGLIRWLAGTQHGAMAFGLTVGMILVLVVHRPQVVETLHNISAYF
jgi:hypothetical protein